MTSVHVPAAYRSVLWVSEGVPDGPAVAGATADDRSAGVEVSVPLGSGPPTHVHPASDEAYFVLSGELDVSTDDRTFRARAGDFVLIPRGTPHTWKSVGDEPARMLFVLSPTSRYPSK